MRYESRNWLTHRIVWTLEVGSIPPGLHVLHTCDNRKCVRPSHLFLGTHLDNMEDRDRKGRCIKGTDSHMAKLTDAQVKAIRYLYRNSQLLQREIAVLFSIDQGAVSRIVSRKSWTHVNDDLTEVL